MIKSTGVSVSFGYYKVIESLSMLCGELMLWNNKTEMHMNYTIVYNKIYPLTEYEDTERKIIVMIARKKQSNTKCHIKLR